MLFILPTYLQIDGIKLSFGRAIIYIWTIDYLHLADMAQTLEWDDLISPQARERAMLNSSKQSEAPLVDHNAMPVEQSYSPDMTEVNLALNGKLVRLAGFIVPLKGHDNKVTAFLLVPYFGACIHVPRHLLTKSYTLPIQKGSKQT